MVSFTFDMAKSRCIVRARPDTTAETICQTINKTKLLSAQQIVKNERGEEVNVAFSLYENCVLFVAPTMFPCMFPRV
jgi:armadillo repeat-containing protein 1